MVLTRVEDILIEEAQAAIDEEVATHAYDNYTTDLQNSTRIAMVTHGDPVEVEIVMDSTHEGRLTESYASIVQANGRTDIDEITDKAGYRIGARLSVGGSMPSGAGSAGSSWTEFLRGRMGPAMKEHGSHGAALRALSAQYKASKGK